MSRKEPIIIQIPAHLAIHLKPSLEAGSLKYCYVHSEGFIPIDKISKDEYELDEEWHMEILNNRPNNTTDVAFHKKSDIFNKRAKRDSVAGEFLERDDDDTIDDQDLITGYEDELP